MYSTVGFRCSSSLVALLALELASGLNDDTAVTTEEGKGKGQPSLELEQIGHAHSNTSEYNMDCCCCCGFVLIIHTRVLYTVHTRSEKQNLLSLYCGCGTTGS